MLNDSTITKFIEDTKTFDNCINECFVKLDIDNDGMLSRDELQVGFGRFLPIWCILDPKNEKTSHLYDIVFEKFDEDHNGYIDTMEFKCLAKEIMLAMARGIGSLPIQIFLYKESLFMKAFEHEFATTFEDIIEHENELAIKNEFEKKVDRHELGKECEFDPLKVDCEQQLVVVGTSDSSIQCKQKGHLLKKVKRFMTKNKNVKANQFCNT